LSSSTFDQGGGSSTDQGGLPAVSAPKAGYAPPDPLAQQEPWDWSVVDPRPGDLDPSDPYVPDGTEAQAIQLGTERLALLKKEVVKAFDAKEVNYDDATLNDFLATLAKNTDFQDQINAALAAGTGGQIESMAKAVLDGTTQDNDLNLLGARTLSSLDAAHLSKAQRQLLSGDPGYIPDPLRDYAQQHGIDLNLLSVNAAADSLFKQYFGHTPTVAEITPYLGKTPTQVESMMRATSSPVPGMNLGQYQDLRDSTGKTFASYFGRLPTDAELPGLLAHSKDAQQITDYVRGLPSHIAGLSMGAYTDLRSAADSAVQKTFGHASSDSVVLSLYNSGITAPAAIQSWVDSQGMRPVKDVPPELYAAAYQAHVPHAQNIYNDVPDFRNVSATLGSGSASTAPSFADSKAAQEQTPAPAPSVKPPLPGANPVKG